MKINRSSGGSRNEREGVMVVVVVGRISLKMRGLFFQKDNNKENEGYEDTMAITITSPIVRRITTPTTIYEIVTILSFSSFYSRSLPPCTLFLSFFFLSWERRKIAFLVPSTLSLPISFFLPILPLS